MHDTLRNGRNPGGNFIFPGICLDLLPFDGERVVRDAPGSGICITTFL